MRHPFRYGVPLIMVGAVTLALAANGKGGPLAWSISVIVAIVIVLVLGMPYNG